MAEKFKFGEKVYELDRLSEEVRGNVTMLKFVSERCGELEKNRVLLQKAKNSYLDNLKNEIISNKAGFLFDDN